MSKTHALHNHTFDYIVVGAGSAGCAVANRLATRDPDASVLLLETGDHSTHSLTVNVPSLFFMNLGNPKLDWDYKTTRQIHTRNRNHYWPRGKLVGGCSGNNAMLYVRGNPEDYNAWEQEHGCEGWGWDAVRPVMDRSEKCVMPASQIDVEYHGTDGPVVVSQATAGSPHPAAKLFVRGCEGVGIGARADGGVLGEDIGPQTTHGHGADYNGSSQFRAATAQVTIENGKRCSTGRAYIDPLIDPKSPKYQPNLVVATGIMVNKILSRRDPINRTLIRANGISGVYLAGSVKVPFRAFAQREVIVSAGAVASPYLLKLSGIGPRKELQARGIPVVKDLPGVGENLQDHLIAGYYIKDLTNTAYTSGLNLTNLKNIAQYMTSKTGPVTSPGVEAMSFFSTDTNLEAKDARKSYTPDRPRPPNIQFHWMSGMAPPPVAKSLLLQTVDPQPLSADTKGFDKKRQVSKMYAPKGGPPFSAFIILVTLLHPRSRGSILLPTDPSVDMTDVHNAVIDPRYLSDERDVEELVEGYLAARRVHHKMRELAPKEIGDEADEPGTLEEIMRAYKFGSKAEAMESREYIAEYVRRTALTLYHPTSTCKMGPSTDATTVVHHRDLRVHGFSNLRVADASVMPAVISGNTNAPAIMIGERCADMVLADWIGDADDVADVRPSTKPLVQIQSVLMAKL